MPPRLSRRETAIAAVEFEEDEQEINPASNRSRDASLRYQSEQNTGNAIVH